MLHAHSPRGRERVWGLALDACAVAVSTLARAAVGDAAPVLSRVTEPLHPSACPLHLVSPDSPPPKPM
ncbi:hypothetical protein CgunFtcFv8_005503 [Champsocephalus gunnari]|uniref:Uncharacterized protein n=1 Tax=Champsocephalus gunnari TaxID=52237 RepID=A0AAN8HD81_CHAGU|nr:hypothetical protein CgunFtcFv8_005503 [Champsocephalus gunnari]